jgi:hypothetical protein
VSAAAGSGSARKEAAMCNARIKHMRHDLLPGWHACCHANVRETVGMPRDNPPSVLDDHMKAFYGQMWAALEQWRKVTDMGGPLKKAMAPWERDVPSISAKVHMGRSGKPSKTGCPMSDFDEIDEIIANTGQLIDDYCAGVQGMQATFDQVNKLFESGVDVGPYAFTFEAAHRDLPSMVAQATAAQAAWKRGMGAFMPRYRKAKLEAADNFKSM